MRELDRCARNGPEAGEALRSNFYFSEFIYCVFSRETRGTYDLSFSPVTDTDRGAAPSEARTRSSARRTLCSLRIPRHCCTGASPETRGATFFCAAAPEREGRCGGTHTRDLSLNSSAKKAYTKPPNPPAARPTHLARSHHILQRARALCVRLGAPMGL